MSNIRDIDRGWKRIKREIALMNGSHVKIGFVSGGKGSDVHKDSVMTVAQVAIANEYGVPEKNIPPRPFMHQALDKNEAKLNARIREYRDAIFAGILNTRKAMSRLGSEHKGDIQQTIKTGKFEPLSPMTIARRRMKLHGRKVKGAKTERPLIDTGQMIQSIQDEVSVGGAKEGAI